ncbi:MULTISPECIES: hypothetical protein [unclassified Bacillus (in: firmicutes)]|uniref:hypothetical protein n=1 Tax=unclassified Bacillus (in: firmicutes) TaxID=185979 RepID=UPI0030100F2B
MNNLFVKMEAIVKMVMKSHMDDFEVHDKQRLTKAYEKEEHEFYWMCSMCATHIIADEDVSWLEAVLYQYREKLKSSKGFLFKIDTKAGTIKKINWRKRPELLKMMEM